MCRWTVGLVSLIVVAGSTLAPAASVEFIMLDTETQGNWKGVYGEDGFNIIMDTEAYPGYAEVTASGKSDHTWAPSTTDIRALEKATGDDRLAACWFNSTPWTIDINFTDGRKHQVAAYFLDWDANNRGTAVEILDAESGEILDSQDMTEYIEGKYLVWEIKGHVVINVIHVSATNAVISGLFFDKAANKGAGEAPSPADTVTDVLRDVQLSWAPGEFAVKHDVYFGTVFDDVNDAHNANPMDVLVSPAQDANAFDPGRLVFGQTYYWRVDEVNGAPDNTVFKGDVWRFEVEPYSIPIPGSTLSVTASSSSNEMSTPEKTIDGSGLDPNGLHDMAAETMWFTAAVDLDPWIQFEFDDVKKLDSMIVWNSNGAAESAIGWGVKAVEIAYSVDGESWDVLADANQFSRAPGLPTYDQYDTVDFGGAAAKFVRLNIQSNWGGILMSYGLSEVQFAMIPVAARAPEPVSGSVGVLPTATIQWRAGREADQHTIYMSTDVNAVADGTAPSATSATHSLDLTSLDLELGQTHYWRVDEVNEAEVPPVWAGPVWTLKTPATLVIDDFEGYSNGSPDRPFQTWLDGIGYSADEFFPVAYGGNGTGAAIGHDIWSLSSPHFDGTIMETSLVYSGSQSLPLYYTNTGGVSSETNRTFTVAQDWTAAGIKSLSLFFRGASDNDGGQLYIKINNTQITYDVDVVDLTRAIWHPWTIDLSTVGEDLSAVSSLTIGIEGTGATGVVTIDNIRLHPVLTPHAALTNHIPVLSAIASSSLGDSFNRMDALCIDGSGLNPDGSHTIVPDGSMWLNNGTFTTPHDVEPEIVFDFGAVYSVDTMLVWNYNEVGDFTKRGIGTADILIAGADGVFSSLIEDQTFDEAPGAGDLDFRQTIDLAGVKAQFIKLDISANHGDDNDFVGLSEVKFEGTLSP
ncbi:MAG: hypothetical protein GY809_19930 [Planctomycetes bacterium]|nr:hypothetical protein [Planctomycetota bacterium]